MKNILIICLLSLAIMSCNSNSSDPKNIKEKKYLYVEIYSEKVFGTNRAKVDTIEIIAKSDSLAYLKAFEKYCISQKASVLINEQLKAAGVEEGYSSSHEFRLFNENSDEICENVVPIDVLKKIALKINAIK